MLNIDVRDEIVKAMEAAEDQKDRAFLALMMRFTDHVERLFADDEMLRRKVLNGDYDTHTSDHEYVTSLRELDTERAVTFVNSRLKTDGYCDHINKIIAEEAESKQTVRSRWNKVVEGVISELPKIVVYAALTLAGYGYLVEK